MSFKIIRRNKIEPSQEFKISLQDNEGKHNLCLRKYYLRCSIPSSENGEVNNHPHYVLRLDSIDNSEFELNGNEKNILQISVSTENRNDKKLLNDTFVKIKNILKDINTPVLYDKVKKVYEISSTFDNSKVVKEKEYRDRIIKDSGIKFKDDNSEYDRIKELPLHLAIDHLSKRNFLSYEMESSETMKITFKNGATSKLGIKPTHLLTKDDMPNEHSEGNSNEHQRFLDFNKNFIKDGKGMVGKGIFSFIRNAEKTCSFNIPFGENANKLTFDLFREFIFSDEYENAINEIKNKKHSSNFDCVVRIPQNDRYSDNNKIQQKALESEKQYIDFLSDIRGVDRKILESMFNKGKMWVGRDFYSNNAENKDNIFEGHKDERDQRPLKLFVGTSHLSDNSNIKSAEGLCFNYKMTKLEKKQLRSFDSMAFSLLSTGRPKMTFISEASIDSLSLYSLLKESDKHNENEYNYVSVMGTGNIPNWLEKNFGVSIKESLGARDGEPIVFYVENKYQKEEIEYSDRERIINNLKKVNFYFNKLKSHKGNKGLEKEQRIAQKVLEDFINEFFKHKDTNKAYKSVKILNGEIDTQSFKFEKKDEYKKYIFDKSNVFEFLKNINITATYNKDAKKYEFHKRVVVAEKYPLTSDNKDKILEIRRKMQDLLKTDTLCFAYDNDLAAFKYLKGFKEMCQILGIKNRVLIPFFQPDKNFKMDALNLNQTWMNDLNDMIRTYRTMVSENKSLEAKNMLDSFLNYIDNDLITDKEVFDILRRNVKVSEAVEKINRNLRRSKESMETGRLTNAISKIYTVNNEFIEKFGYRINLDELLERNNIDFPLLIKPKNKNIDKIKQTNTVKYKK